MTKNDISDGQDLTERQRKAIPHLVASPTYEEGRKKARISRNALYEWLKNPVFKEELKKAREIIVTEALETLKSSVTKATETLVDLLTTTENDSLKRLICNDIISHTLKAKELQDIEERLSSIERIVLERRSYK